MAILCGLSLMLEPAFASATLPLLHDGVVDALEYSFELGWAAPQALAQVDALLSHYADAGRLWGHGVTMSPLTVDDRGHVDRWLARAADECRRRPYRGVSEHYGFMRAAGIDGGAPLPPPPCDAAIEVGRAALVRLAEATRAPVGLENLALAFGPADVAWQGPAIAAMLDAVDGELVLDLHNLYCQAANYGLDPRALLASYPLSRVRCVHVSGGSWSLHGGRPFRRDTHDDAVPDEVLDLVAPAIAACEHLEVVFLERIGPSVRTDADGAALRREFLRLRELVADAEARA